MKRIAKLATSVVLLAAVALCLLGFLHSLEPAPHSFAFRVGYAVLGFAFLFGALLPFALRPADASTTTGTARSVTTMFWLLLAAFCGFGFWHSFEPGPHHLAFRIGYAVVGLACLLGALRLAAKYKALSMSRTAKFATAVFCVGGFIGSLAPRPNRIAYLTGSDLGAVVCLFFAFRPFF